LVDAGAREITLLGQNVNAWEDDDGRGLHDLIRTRSHWDCSINEGHLQSWDHSHFRNLAERHCGLKILKWGFDTVLIPPFSMLVERLFGSNAALWCETGPFKKLFPFASLSVIALMEPVEGFIDPSC